MNLKSVNLHEGRIWCDNVKIVIKEFIVKLRDGYTGLIVSPMTILMLAVLNI
jgi:hypothetical protein